jgi:DHA1 family multidrug resistance protein-like MFS transporter
MMENLGVQWAGTLLGCIAAAMIPIPVLFRMYGPWLRQKSKLACASVYSPQKKGDV